MATFTVDAPDALAGLLDELRAVPGVEAVSVADARPVRVARSPLRIRIPGLEPPPGRDAWVVDSRSVGGGYLETVGIPMRSGRDFTDADARQGPRVAVVSATFEERFWPESTATGRSLVVGGESVRIVGVAEDARYLAQDEDPDALVYLSLAGELPTLAVVTLRASAPERLSSDVRRLVSAHTPSAPQPTIRSVRAVMDAALLPQRLGAGMVGGMGLAALLLAIVGLYGLVQYSVARQTPELALRLALGGTGRNVLMVVLRKGFGLAVVGTLVGTAVALLLAPSLVGFLGGVSPRDPLVFGVVIATFVAVAFAASWLPARRAASIEPARVLRGS